MNMDFPSYEDNKNSELESDENKYARLMQSYVDVAARLNAALSPDKHHFVGGQEVNEASNDSEEFQGMGIDDVVEKTSKASELVIAQLKAECDEALQILRVFENGYMGNSYTADDISNMIRRSTENYYKEYKDKNKIA